MLSGIRLKRKLAPQAAKFHAIAHSSRLSIIYILGKEPTDVSCIIERLKLSPSLISHHLSVLTKSGWVTKTKTGKVATYSLVPGAAEDIIKFLGTLRGPA